MDYEACYYNARNRYYNACSEINGCENRVYDLKNQRRNTVNRINRLKADTRNTQTALNEMAHVLKSEDSLNRSLSAVADKTSQAAVNFSTMVAASDVKSRDLTNVYGNEAARTKTELENILSTLKTRQKGLEDRLADLQNQLNSAKSELDDIDAQIRATESERRSWESVRRSAANDMEYYRRKMQMAV